MRIAVTTGEPAGIGPDIAALLTCTHSILPCACQLTVIGDLDVLHERARMMGVKIGADTDVNEKPISLLHVATDVPVVVGVTDPRNARYVLAQIDTAIGGCRDGTFDALVTGPVNKATLNDAGIAFSGHTEYLAAACGCDTVMMLACEGLRVALTTTHLPLRNVADALTREHLERTLHIVHADMQRLFGIARPRISVCGLNPHAGEGGHLGREEEQVIRPVLEQLAATMDLTGPLPADTAFTPQRLSACDVVVAMYHDQGLPVIKHADFDNTVNITLGLPFVRTSVDHGTALELAGSGNASAENLTAAVICAQRLAEKTLRQASAQTATAPDSTPVP